jgi:hypothetical protein
VSLHLPASVFQTFSLSIRYSSNSHGRIPAQRCNGLPKKKHIPRCPALTVCLGFAGWKPCWLLLAKVPGTPAFSISCSAMYGGAPSRHHNHRFCPFRDSALQRERPRMTNATVTSGVYLVDGHFSGIQALPKGMRTTLAHCCQVSSLGLATSTLATQ